jgi:hypothetical protein
LITSNSLAAAAWHEGKVTGLSSSYDGSSITFSLKDLTPESPAINYSLCTCNSSWQLLCLNPARQNFDREYSMLLAAQLAGKNVRVIFEDSVCFVVAVVLVD